MVAWYRYLYITTTMTSGKHETVSLIEWRLTQNVMWDHLRKECGTIQRENRHLFTGVSGDGGRHQAVFHSAWFWLGQFFQFVGLLGLSSCLMGIMLCMFFVTLPFAFQCMVLNALQSCWQMPDKCHMQSPSGSALCGGGGQLSLCFHPEAE